MATRTKGNIASIRSGDTNCACFWCSIHMYSACQAIRILKHKPLVLIFWKDFRIKEPLVLVFSNTPQRMGWFLWSKWQKRQQLYKLIWPGSRFFENCNYVLDLDLAFLDNHRWLYIQAKFFDFLRNCDCVPQITTLIATGYLAPFLLTT